MRSSLFLKLGAQHEIVIRRIDRRIVIGCAAGDPSDFIGAAEPRDRHPVQEWLKMYPGPYLVRLFEVTVREHLR